MTEVPHTRLHQNMMMDFLKWTKWHQNQNSMSKFNAHLP